MHPLIRKLLNVVSPSPPEISSPPTPAPSPAQNAEPAYEPVVRADAIAELSFPSGDRDLDALHAALIDLIQGGFVNSVRGDDGQLRFGVTDLGKQKINEILGGGF
jgi:hypothetical protein